MTLYVSKMSGQSYNQSDMDIQEFIENMFQTPEENINYDDLYESLIQLYNHPIDLNDTNKSELSSLYQLSPLQIDHLIFYINQNKPLLSVYELQVIEGFDHSTIEKILPFIQVKSPNDHNSRGQLIERISHEPNNYLILRTERTLQSQKGYSNDDSTGYLGSPYKLYGRYRASHSKDFSAGFTFEKDAGETIDYDRESKKYGFDYYSFHLFLYEKRQIKKFAIGDYQMQFGQGLVLGAGFNPGKGAETITTIRRSNTGLSPYASALETGFMRGLALTYAYKDFLITPFYSRLKQDGVLKSSDFNGDYNTYISSIQNIGMHRTAKELSARKTIQEETMGMNITFEPEKFHKVQIGSTLLFNRFSIPIIKTPNNYNQFEFNGSENWNTSIFANFNLNNFLLFSEFAQSKSKGTAFVGGIIGSLSPIVSISFHFRKYSKDFHSFYGNAFGEGSRNINETGLYWGIKISPNRRVSFNAYYDYFKFPWLKFGTNAPSQGYEYLARANYNPSRKVKLYVQIRKQVKQISTTFENGNLFQLSQAIKHNYTFDIDLKATQNLSFKSRIQGSTYGIEKDKTNGIAVIQDVNLKFDRFTLSTRFALFDTDDYENRQYVYEKEPLYIYSIQPYAYKGFRNYIVAQFNASKKLTFWLKYGSQKFVDRELIGSGLNLIEGNVKSEMKAQIRYKF